MKATLSDLRGEMSGHLAHKVRNPVLESKGLHAFDSMIDLRGRIDTARERELLDEALACARRIELDLGATPSSESTRAAS